ncbi:uncharacterized protein LOC114957052 [Acropora millepora]|uniref:uncharacterized protein LOC114957052 n=1 Tax=Acropora millepora TaxID=45264 RepID=UPI001CF19EFF|nr:uncharacterized protein LOC114957052 [Acropora millepora]
MEEGFEKAWNNVCRTRDACDSALEVLQPVRLLFKVLKDHNNTFMAELVESSHRHCFEHEFEKFLGEAQSQDLEECGAENVARVCLGDHSFQSSLSLTVEKLQEARLVIDQFGFGGHDSTSQVAIETGIEQARISDKLTVPINDIGIAMKKLGYALYGGKVYKKCERAKYSYWYKCEMEAFINSLASNETFKDRLLKDMRKVSEILSNPHCKVIRPLCVDYNFIEVNDGQCWSIMDRRFVDNAIADKDIGHITPRAFSKYDPTKEPDPKYFKETLENSLSVVEVQLFCEDFLKLLNHNKKRHKDKVPCLVGAANSGKTSLFQPILGLVHHHNVVTITKQRVFNKAMINRFTQVIFIDEASPSTLDIDEWKILTQGGYTACNVEAFENPWLFALDGRRRWCVSQGLLKKDQRHLVTDPFQCLPIAEDACELIGTEEDGNEAASSRYRSNTTASQNFSSQRRHSSGEEMFITPVPSSQLRPCYAATSASSFTYDLAISEDLTRTTTTRKRSKSGERARVGKKKPRKTLLSYFSQK